MTGKYTLAMTADELMAESRRLTGIDIVDHAVQEPLAVLVESINRDGGLHAAGAIAKHNKLLRLLSNRLRMQRDFQQHPEIADIKIENPVFVIGLARSGTTKTQKTLAATGDFNWLPFWQTYNPALLTGDRSESIQPRIDDAEAYCRWFDESSPETKLGHPFEALEPEEDTTLTEGSFVAPSFIGYAHVPGYLEWFATQDMKIQFEYLLDTLKYLQWQGLASADKPWLLKAPTYYGLEPQLLEVFPDARLVMTHRSPFDTVGSSCKLVSLFRKPFVTRDVDAGPLLAGFKMMMNVHIANRASMKNLNILDIHFDDINQAMDAVVEKIYAHIGLPLSATALENIRQWENRNPMHKKGKFKYSLEEFGLSKDKVGEEMAAYRDLINTLFDK